MMEKLLGRHRLLRLGATIVGASALAVGFASPALAAQNVNNGNADNANAQNYLIVQGGSNTAYYLMQAEADIFNQAPGCDLAGQSGNDQPLDYGCPGLNGEEGTTQPAAGTTVFTNVNLTVAVKNVVVASGASNLVVGDQIYDSAGAIPVGDPILQIKSDTKFKVQFKPTASAPNDTITVVSSAQQGENGFSSWGQQNPFNDVLVEEPSLGSSNGVQELEGTGNAATVGHSNSTNDPSGFGPVNVAPLDAARSSRAPKLATGGDFQGLNFVAYAEDAVTDLYWTKYNNASTDAATCLAAIGGNPTKAELTSIWNETYTGGVPNKTWSGVFGTNGGACSNNPIYAYWSQNGSGTESTWASATSATFPVTASNWPARQIIFENETSSILDNNAAAPVGDVMFFFSYGKFNKVCAPLAGTESSTLPDCAGTDAVAGGAANKVTLGTDEAGITLSQSSINAQLPGLVETTPYFGDRLLYNVYSDGFNSNLPASSPATLNAISEDGFMCKPSTAWDIDPNTGLTYKAEIETAITNQGFFPLPNLQVEDGQNDTTTPTGVNPGYNTTASAIPHPAWTLGLTLGTAGLSGSKYNAANEGSASTWKFNPVNQDDDNSAVSGTYNNVEDDSATLSNGVVASPGNPVGYCITLSTDGGGGGS